MSKSTSQGYSVEFDNDICQLKNSKKYVVVHGIWKNQLYELYVPCNRMCECNGVSAHVASATKLTHVATSVVKLVHVVGSASCIWCKLMASIVEPSWCWKFEVTSKTKASRWIFHPQGYKIGILHRLCAQEVAKGTISYGWRIMHRN